MSEELNIELTEEDYDKIAEILNDTVGEITFSDLDEEKFYNLLAIIVKTSYIVGYFSGANLSPTSEEEL